MQMKQDLEFSTRNRERKKTSRVFFSSLYPSQQIRADIDRRKRSSDTQTNTHKHAHTHTNASGIERKAENCIAEALGRPVETEVVALCIK